MDILIILTNTCLLMNLIQTMDYSAMYTLLYFISMRHIPLMSGIWQLEFELRRVHMIPKYLLLSI